MEVDAHEFTRLYVYVACGYNKADDKLSIFHDEKEWDNQ